MLAKLGMNLKQEHTTITICVQHLRYLILEVMSWEWLLSCDVYPAFKLLSSYGTRGCKVLSSPGANLSSAFLASTCLSIMDMVPLSQSLQSSAYRAFGPSYNNPAGAWLLRSTPSFCTNLCPSCALLPPLVLAPQASLPPSSSSRSDLNHLSLSSLSLFSLNT